ncbi:MAG: large conductance mechanosensitive channel protein MscL [Candidatus Binataceae bacterium]
MMANDDLEGGLDLARRFQKLYLRKAHPKTLLGGGNMSGFKSFLLRGNVVDMAVGIVVGAAFGTVVSAFVKDLLTPFIAAIVKKPDFSAIAFTLNGSRFLIGSFVNEAISFILVAGAVYFVVVMPMNRLLARLNVPTAPTTKRCSECLSEIPLAARRCAFCSSVIAE